MHECLQASCRSPKRMLSKACVPHTSVLFCSSKWILTLLHSRGLKNPAWNHLTFSVTMSDEQEVRKSLKMFDGIWFFQAKLLKLYHSLWHRNCSASTWFLRSTERLWLQPSNNNNLLWTAFFFQNPTLRIKDPPNALLMSPHATLTHCVILQRFWNIFSGFCPSGPSVCPISSSCCTFCRATLTA